MLKDSWISIIETANYLSVSTSTVKRMLSLKRNPDLIIKRIGSDVRILKSSIDNLDKIRTR